MSLGCWYRLLSCGKYWHPQAYRLKHSLFSSHGYPRGGVRFPVDPLIISTVRFYDLCPDQLPPNFYRVVSCVSRLNQRFGSELNHHEINFMYSLCGNIRTNYYLKTRDMQVRLISCLPDSNKNSTGEFVRVSGNWIVDELPCPFSPRDVGWYQEPSFVLGLHFLLNHLRTN